MYSRTIADASSDRAHLLRAVAAHVEDRPHVQRADGRVRVPRAARAVLAKDLGEAIDVIGEVRKRDGAILDERHRLAVPLHAHHDVEPGLAHVPKRLLRARVRHLHDALGKTQVRDHSHEVLELAPRCARLLAHELHEQDRLRLADERRVDDRPEGGVAAREVDHGAIELHRGGPEGHDVARVFHRAIKRPEVHHAKRSVRRQRRDLERQAARPRERAFAAHEKMRVINAFVARIGPLALRIEHVDVVAADAAQHVRHICGNLVALPRADRAQRPDELAHARIRRIRRLHRRFRSESPDRAVG